jgi:hypothetical protein
VIVDQHVELYRSSAPARLKRNVEACLGRWSIDRPEFEGLINRLSQDAGPIFYVSTVSRGQAGTTSDLDVIVVGDSGRPAVALSNMLFHRGRRVGAKVIDETRIATAIAQLNSVSRSGDDPLGCPAPPLAVKLADLERLVNGFSFEAGTPYLHALPALCRWTYERSLSDYVLQRACCALADAAGAQRAAQVHLTDVLVAAMDVVMAAHGRVQSNTKWTMVRWEEFRREETGVDAEVVGVIDRTRDRLRAGVDLASSLLDALNASFTQFVGPALPDELGLQLASDVKIGRYLTGAVYLTRPGRTAILAAENEQELADLLACAPGLPPDRAGTALTLLQQGFAAYRPGGVS